VRGRGHPSVEMIVCAEAGADNHGSSRGFRPARLQETSGGWTRRREVNNEQARPKWLNELRVAPDREVRRRTSLFPIWAADTRLPQWLEDQCCCPNLEVEAPR
jgi:hypothetical protein